MMIIFRGALVHFTSAQLYLEIRFVLHKLHDFYSTDILSSNESLDLFSAFIQIRSDNSIIFNLFASLVVRWTVFSDSTPMLQPDLHIRALNRPKIFKEKKTNELTLLINSPRSGRNEFFALFDDPY